MKFMKPCWTDINILLTLKQDAFTYVGNVIYAVRVQVNVRDRLAKKSFSALLYCSEKKLKKIGFLSDGHFKGF